MTLRRERLELPDGDFVDLDWVGGIRLPIVLLLHGLKDRSNHPMRKACLRRFNITVGVVFL